MFSTLLAKASEAVPSSQPALDLVAGDDQARGDVERPLEPDGAPDVGRVAFAEGLLDVGANGVEFTPEVLDVGVAQVRVRTDVGDCH